MQSDTVSLNFVDLNQPSGPGINETEFNVWLQGHEKNCMVITSCTHLMLDQSRTVTLGISSLRAPFSFVLKQLKAAEIVIRATKKRGIVYYRHSRMAFGILLIRAFRPDIKIASHRLNGIPAADSAIRKGKIARAASIAIERVDWLIRKRLARSSYWVDCVTAEQADNLAKSIGRPINVVPNGVNTEKFFPLSTEEMKSNRSRLKIPEDAIVVGYCGGAPMQRGATQVRALVDSNREVFGVIVGRLSSDEIEELAHERMRLIGEVEYNAVRQYIGTFDIAVAFDDVVRARAIGNSNQKIRQAIACGCSVVTFNSDIEMTGSNKFLGTSLNDKEVRKLSDYVVMRRSTEEGRSERYEYAKKHLSIEKIFMRRHQNVADGIVAFESER